MRSIGNYELVEVIGRGGMGVVYRARHVHDGSLVALKTIRTHGDRDLDGIRREIRTLARISHPGIVRIREHGLHQGTPWYAMELLEGITLNKFIHKRKLKRNSSQLTTSNGTTDSDTFDLRSPFPTTPTRGKIRTEYKPEEGEQFLPDHSENPAEKSREDIPYHQILTLGRWICSPLSYLHGEGMVHRDLKPENIFISNDGLPVLVDFGLTAQFTDTISRDVLQLEQIGVGTASYISPEQIRGELVDARADLYAFGCILYELLTGHPPFVAAHIKQILYAHLNSQALPPSKFNIDVSEDLDQLVLALLAKNPRDRIGYADFIANELARISGETEKLFPGEKSKIYIYRPGFRGREQEFSRMKEFSTQILQGNGGIVFVSGESGIGKTRFILECGLDLAKHGVNIFTGECTENSGVALEVFRNTLMKLADYCREFGPGKTGQVFGKRGKLLAQYEPSLADLPGLEGFPEPRELPVQQATMRLYSYLFETFSTVAKEKPFVLLLDNLHWADELSRGFLSFLIDGSNLSNLPMFLICSYRSELLESKLGDLVNAPDIDRIELEGIDKETLEKVVGDILSIQTPPKALTTFLWKHSSGNPFFISEYIRLAIEQNLLWRNNQGQWQVATNMASEYISTHGEGFANLPVPQTMNEVIELRLTSLSEMQHTIVTACAIVNRDVNSELLRQITGLSEEEIWENTDALLSRKLLEKTQHDTFQLFHPQMADNVITSLAEEQKNKFCLAAVKAIEDRKKDSLGPFFSTLASLRKKLGDIEQARDYYLKAARRAFKQLAFLEATKCFRKYLDLVDIPTSESIEARNTLGEKIFIQRGQFEEAEEQLLLALEEANLINDSDNSMRSKISLGVLFWRKSDFEAARNIFIDALSEARKANKPLLEAEILRKLGDTDYFIGDNNAAETWYLKSIAIGEREHDMDVLARGWANYAILFGHDDTERSIECMEKSLSYIEQLKDEILGYILMGNMAIAYYDKRDYQKAEQQFQQSLELGQQYDDIRHVALCLGNLANTRSHFANTADVFRLYQQSITILRQIGDQHSEASYCMNAATHYVEEGLLEEADTVSSRAVELSRKGVSRKQILCKQLLELIAVRLRRTEDYEKIEVLLDEATEANRDDPHQSNERTIAGYRGLVAIARGKDASGYIKKMERLSEGFESKLIRMLRKSQEYLEEGKAEQLYHGMPIDYLEKPLQRKIKQQRK